MENLVRLPLDNAYNVRELGGYCTHDDKITKWHKFLRADDISALSKDDIEFLLQYGVNTVIDLRSKTECINNPDALLNIKGVKYYHVPFMKGDIDDVTKNLTQNKKLDLGDFYVELVKEKHLVAELLKVIAETEDGCVLFHCSAGKDRTGVLSMLLLMIAGVKPSDIEANYQLTYTYLKQKPGLLDMIPEDMDMSCMYSHPETIRKAIDYILEYYGDIDNYLKECGIDQEMLNHLRYKLLNK